MSARVICVVVGLALGGCSTVAPWERGYLAKPQMTQDVEASQRALLEHIYESREAAAGKTSAKGGGCGCY